MREGIIMKVRYFDHAATTPTRREVIISMIPYFGIEFGNPSSMYSKRKKKQTSNTRCKTKSGKCNKL